MAPGDPDESFFLDAMADLGVERLDGRESPKQKAKRSPGSVRSARPTKASKAAPAGRDTPPASQAAPPTASESASGRSSVELRCRELETRYAELETRFAGLEARYDELEARHAELAQLRESERAEYRKLAAKRDRMAAELGDSRRRVAELERRAANRSTLRHALEQRGCRGTDEAVTVLQGMLTVRPDELLDTVDLATPENVAAMLDNRVAIVAEDRTAELEGECAVLRVPADRCEITEGSDIRAAFHEFRQACRRAGVRRVTIVGGSPAYRNELKNLAPTDRKELRVDLMSGTQQRSRRRAESNVRASDLVVIWSATELDHSVSDVYSHSETPMVRVPHRGISRMLRHVAESLADSGRGRGRAGKPRSRGGKQQG